MILSVVKKNLVYLYVLLCAIILSTSSVYGSEYHFDGGKKFIEVNVQASKNGDDKFEYGDTVSIDIQGKFDTLVKPFKRGLNLLKLSGSRYAERFGRVTLSASDFVPLDGPDAENPVLVKIFILKPRIESVYFDSTTEVVVQEGEKFKVYWKTSGCKNLDYEPTGSTLGIKVLINQVTKGSLKGIASQRVDNLCRDNNFVVFEAPTLGAKNVESIKLSASIASLEDNDASFKRVTSEASLLVMLKLRSWSRSRDLVFGNSMTVAISSTASFLIDETKLPSFKAYIKGSKSVPISNVRLLGPVASKGSQHAAYSYSLSFNWEKVLITSINEQLTIDGVISLREDSLNGKLTKHVVSFRPLSAKLAAEPTLDFQLSAPGKDTNSFNPINTVNPDALTFFEGEQFSVLLSNLPNFTKGTRVKLMADEVTLHDNLNLNTPTAVTFTRKTELSVLGFYRMVKSMISSELEFAPKKVYLKVVSSSSSKLKKDLVVDIPLEIAGNLRFLNFQASNSIQLSLSSPMMNGNIFELGDEINVVASISGALPALFDRVARNMKVSLRHGGDELTSTRWMISQSNLEFKWRVDPRALINWSSRNTEMYEIKVDYFDYENNSSQRIKAPSPSVSFLVRKPTVSAISLEPSEFIVDGEELLVKWEVAPFCPSIAISSTGEVPFSATLKLFDTQDRRVIKSLQIDDYCSERSLRVRISGLLGSHQTERNLKARIDDLIESSNSVSVLRHANMGVPVDVTCKEDHLFPGMQFISVALDISSEPDICAPERDFEFAVFGVGESETPRVQVDDIEPDFMTCTLKLKLTWPSDLRPFQSNYNSVMTVQGKFKTPSGRTRRLQSFSMFASIGSIDLEFSHPTIEDAEAFFIGELVKVRIVSNKKIGQLCDFVDDNLLRIESSSSSSTGISFNVCDASKMVLLPASSELFLEDGQLVMSIGIKGVPLRANINSKRPVIYRSVSPLLSAVQPFFHLNESISFNNLNEQLSQELVKRKSVLLQISRWGKSSDIVYKSENPLLSLDSLSVPSLFTVGSNQPFGRYLAYLVSAADSEIEFTPVLEDEAHSFEVARPPVDHLAFDQQSPAENSDSFTLSWYSSVCSSLNSLAEFGDAFKATLLISRKDNGLLLHRIELDSYCEINKYTVQGLDSLVGEEVFELVAVLEAAVDGVSLATSVNSLQIHGKTVTIPTLQTEPVAASQNESVAGSQSDQVASRQNESDTAQPIKKPEPVAPPPRQKEPEATLPMQKEPESPSNPVSTAPPAMSANRTEDQKPSSTPKPTSTPPPTQSPSVLSIVLKTPWILAVSIISLVSFLSLLILIIIWRVRRCRKASSSDEPAVLSPTYYSNVGSPATQVYFRGTKIYSY